MNFENIKNSKIEKFIRNFNTFLREKPKNVLQINTLSLVFGEESESNSIQLIGEFSKLSLKFNYQS